MSEHDHIYIGGLCIRCYTETSNATGVLEKLFSREPKDYWKDEE